MNSRTTQTNFSLTELFCSILIVAVLTSAALPMLTRARGDSMLQESMQNLAILGMAHVMYAADYNGRQVTHVVDDLAVFGSVANYNSAHGCSNSGYGPWDPSCHPPTLAGWCEGSMYAYWPANIGHYWVVNPIGFPGESGIDYFGNFRLTNSKPLHDYFGDRFYSPIFYAPADTGPYEEASQYFDEPCEFAIEGNPPDWSSYCWSPAAMYHPDVMRANADGGWQSPWDFAEGFESPGLFQAAYADLKTQLIEHNWLQGPPADCNPGFEPIFGPYPCAPFQFNHGIDSTPAALFFDGHVALLPNTEVYAADQQILKQTGGEDGLWHRGTPFGEDGYYIPFGYDGVPLSHHILTTDGILGRDTLNGKGFAGKSKFSMDPDFQANKLLSIIDSLGIGGKKTSSINHSSLLQGQQP